jgi:hypothetical protein
MCLPISSTDAVVWLFGFVIFALVGGGNDPFEEKLAWGMTVPALCILVGHLIFS